MEKWEYPYRVHKIQLSDSIKLAYVDEGEGDEVLLFIHGLGSNLKGWKKNIDDLKRCYRCIAMDLPGYGKSSKDDYPFGMLFFAKILEVFVEKLGVGDIHLVGHSMGGQIALLWALRNDRLIKSLILLAPAGIETFSGTEKDQLVEITSPQVIEDLDVNQIISNFRMNFYEMPEDALFMVEDRLLLRDDPEYTDFSLMVSSCVLSMLNEPVAYDLQKVNVPVLIMYGNEDRLIPNELLHSHMTTAMVAETAYNMISNCKLTMVPSAGHFLQWEQSDKVNQEIECFIDEYKK